MWCCLKFPVGWGLQSRSPSLVYFGVSWDGTGSAAQERGADNSELDGPAGPDRLARRRRYEPRTDSRLLPDRGPPAQGTGHDSEQFPDRVTRSVGHHFWERQECLDPSVLGTPLFSPMIY
jgi:hypothetical protein